MKMSNDSLLQKEQPYYDKSQQDNDGENTEEFVGALFHQFESIPSVGLLKQVQSIINLISQKGNLFSRKEALLKNEKFLQNEKIKIEATLEALENNASLSSEEKEKERTLLSKKLGEVSNKLKAIPIASEELEKKEIEFLKQINSLKRELNQNYLDHETLIDEMIQRITEPGKLNLRVISDQIETNNLPAVLNDKQLVLYYQLLPIAELFFSSEKVGNPAMHAFKLALLNSTPEQAMKFIEESAKYNPDSEYVLHDACLFTLPRLEQINLETWLQIGQKMRGDFTQFKEQFLNQIWPQAEEIQKWLDGYQKTKDQRLSAGELKSKINELNKIKREYKILDRHHGTLTDSQKKRYDELQVAIYTLQCELTELGVEFSKDIHIEILEAVRKKQFTEAQPEFKIFLQNGLNQSNFNKFLQLDRSEGGKNIPEMTIDGASIDESFAGYYLMKVNVQNDAQAARAACYGKLTNCCQSISGEAGEPCAIHGLTSPNGGFYIICKGDPKNPKPDDELVAQSWTWLGKSGSLVLDSIETANREDEDKIIKFYRKLAYELVKQNLAPRVLTGATAGLTPYVGFEQTKNYQDEYFLDYNGYCDSRTKKTLCEPDYLYYYYNSLPEANDTIEQFIEAQIIECLNNPKHRYDSLVEMINYDYLCHSAIHTYENFKQITDKFPEDKWIAAFIPPEATLTHANTLVNQLFSTYPGHDPKVNQLFSLIIEKLFEKNLLDPENDSGLYYAMVNSKDYLFYNIAEDIKSNNYNPERIVEVIASKLFDFRLEDIERFMNVINQAKRNNWGESFQNLHKLLDEKLGLAGAELPEAELGAKLRLKIAIERLNPSGGIISLDGRPSSFAYQFASDSFVIQASSSSNYDEELDANVLVTNTLLEDKEQIESKLKSIGFNDEVIERITTQFSEGQKEIIIKLDEDMKQQVLSANTPKLESITPRSTSGSRIKEKLDAVLTLSSEEANDMEEEGRKEDGSHGM